jgi:hypothetical protein
MAVQSAKELTVYKKAYLLGSMIDKPDPFLLAQDR